MQVALAIWGIAGLLLNLFGLLVVERTGPQLIIAEMAWIGGMLLFGFAAILNLMSRANLSLDYQTNTVPSAEAKQQPSAEAKQQRTGDVVMTSGIKSAGLVVALVVIVLVILSIGALR